MFGHYEKWQTANIIRVALCAIKQYLTSSFKILNKIKDEDFAETVTNSLWKKNVQFRIQGIYSPRYNKNRINKCASSHRYVNARYNRVGGIVGDCTDGNEQTIICNEKEPKTFSLL